MSYEKTATDQTSPGGFTDASAAGNSPRFMGLGGKKCAKAHCGTGIGRGQGMKEHRTGMEDDMVTE